MNKTITSHEAILTAGKEIVLEIGLQGLNIRDVARRCGVSVGSIYNYFPTKSDLIVATIESIWKEIMRDYDISETHLSFVQSIEGLFTSVLKGSEKYAYFFSAHSVSVAALDKSKGRESMDNYFAQIKQGLLASLNADGRVRENAFSRDFTKERFVDFVFGNLISLLMNRERSCDFLMEAISRMIY